jgi:hypothetical protein
MGQHSALQESHQQAGVNRCRTTELPHSPWHSSVCNLQRKAAGCPGRHARPRPASTPAPALLPHPGSRCVTGAPAPASLPGPARAEPPPARRRARRLPVWRRDRPPAHSRAHARPAAAAQNCPQVAHQRGAGRGHAQQLPDGVWDLLVALLRLLRPLHGGQVHGRRRAGRRDEPAGHHLVHDAQQACAGRYDDSSSTSREQGRSCMPVPGTLPCAMRPPAITSSTMLSRPARGGRAAPRQALAGAGPRMQACAQRFVMRDEPAGHHLVHDAQQACPGRACNAPSNATRQTP